MSKHFPGGVVPPHHMVSPSDVPIADLPVPDEVVVPLSQHIGKPATPVVRVTDVVRRGQVIGEQAGFVSAPVHSPVSGTVKRMVQVAHPLGMMVDAVLIENDHTDEWADGCNVERDALSLAPEEIVQAVQNGGIVGMGGATFPTHVKLSPPKDKPIDTVILNGVECEPFLTCDCRLMVESPESIVKGMQLVMKAVGATRGIVAVEADTPEAFKTMTDAVTATGNPQLEVRMFPVCYPQGGEKQLIYACLQREVPSGGLPMDAGVVVQNVATCHAIYEAVALNRPLTERICTVTGNAIPRPANLRVRIGTPASAALEACGFDPDKTDKVIFGGPMTGPAQFDVSLPIAKGGGALVAFTGVKTYTHRDCIRCGRCVDGCPMNLIPSEISILAERGLYLETKDANVMDCIECGVCTFVCPARRPIVHWIKACKGELAKEHAKQMAAKQ